MSGAGLADTAAAPVQDEERFFRLSLGSLDCTALKDGFVTGPTRPLAPEVPTEDLRSLLSSQGDHPDIRHITIACLHVRPRGGRGMLVDAGIGKLLGLDGKPLLTAGFTAASLRAAGIAPGEVETVLVSHIHPDHIGGLFDEDDQAVFPNARYHVSREELAFWEQPEPDLGGTLLPPFAQADCIKSARRFLAVASGRLEPFAAGENVTEGVRSIRLPGHTPGQVGFLFETGAGAPLFYTADAAANRAVSLQKPDWRFAFDCDSSVAIATRKWLIDFVVENGWPLFTPHFPWPAIGRIVRDDETRWVPGA